MTEKHNINAEKMLRISTKALVDELERIASINGAETSWSTARNNHYAVLLFKEEEKKPKAFVIEMNGTYKSITPNCAKVIIEEGYFQKPQLVNT